MMLLSGPHASSEEEKTGLNEFQYGGFQKQGAPKQIPIYYDLFSIRPPKKGPLVFGNPHIIWGHTCGVHRGSHIVPSSVVYYNPRKKAGHNDKRTTLKPLGICYSQYDGYSGRTEDGHRVLYRDCIMANTYVLMWDPCSLYLPEISTIAHDICRYI